MGLMLPTAARTDDGRVDAARVIAAARRAEAAGFDGVYVGDHLVHPRPLLESVVTLTAVATATDRVAFGPCVMLIALRQPLVLAKQLATLATFVPGRLRVGVGVGGEYPVEFEAAGVPLAQRGMATEQSLRQLRALLAGRPAVVGPEGKGRAVTVNPAVPADIPFLLGGWSEPSLRRAAGLADGWIGYLLSAEGFTRRRAFLLRCRADLGLADQPFSTGMLLAIHPDPDAPGASGRAAAAWARVTANDVSFPERLFVSGPPDQLVEGLRRYWDAGCDEMVLAIADQGAGYLDQLDVLADDVLPRVRAFA